MSEEPKTYAAAVGLVPTLSTGVMAVSVLGLAAMTLLIGALGAGALAVQFALFSAIVSSGAIFGYRAVRSAVWPSVRDDLDGALEVTPDALVVRKGGRIAARVRRGDLASGYAFPVEAGGAFVVVRPEFGREIVAWMPFVEQARSFLDAVELSPAHKPATFSFFFDMHVTVGADGVLVRWPLLRRRVFLSHKRIDDVRWRDDRIVLVLVDGDHYEINTGTRQTDTQRALLERLLEARKAYVAGEAAVQVTSLARNARSARDWVTELRAMTTGGQYRSAALPSDALYRIAVDPTENEEHRIGAALALRSVLDDEGRERLRLAAGSSASPRVRVVLAAAADEEDDDAIAAAIEPRAKKA